MANATVRAPQFITSASASVSAYPLHQVQMEHGLGRRPIQTATAASGTVSGYPAAVTFTGLTANAPYAMYGSQASIGYVIFHAESA